MTAKALKRRRMVGWLAGQGIEIGALHNALAVGPAARVIYVDRMTEAELRAHYPELAGLALAPVSVLGDAQNLSTFPDASLDFVIANHLLEHIEDPIRALSEMSRVLRQGGILYLALPDQRVTFDRDRPLTDVDHLISEHRTGTEQTRRSHFEEWVDLVEPLITDWPHLLSDENLEPRARVERLMELDYSIHFHVWSPETFLSFLSAARHETALDLQLLAFEACSGAEDDDEFIVVLAKGQQLTQRPPDQALDRA